MSEVFGRVSVGVEVVFSTGGGGGTSMACSRAGVEVATSSEVRFSLDLFFFTMLVHKVLFSPVFDFAAFFVLAEMREWLLRLAKLVDRD